MIDGKIRFKILNKNRGKPKFCYVLEYLKFTEIKGTI